MKLDDFLKRKKVRCINRDNHGYLTENKVYDVIGALFGRRNDNGDIIWYDMTCFKLVIESAENPLQGVELTPEFETESSEPKFKVGDKVYLFGTNYIEEITKIIGANVYLAGADFDASVSIKEICHATPENCERLQATFTDIEFERPPKPLSGDALVRAMLKKGIKNVLCLWGNGDKIIIDRLSYKGGLMNTNCNIVGGLTPIDWYTDEPLTEAVLDE